MTLIDSWRWNWLRAILVAVACASHGTASERPSNRTDSVEAICRRLEIGPGAVIADVGCGNGPDTMIFASIVGSNGTVLAQEIDVNQLKRVAERADQRGFHQVVPVLGQSGDPHLPDGFSDLVYLNRVFHHLARPREMLDRLWLDLKPGGLLVIVDQQKGPLRDWTPTEKREKEHHWTGETTGASSLRSSPPKNSARRDSECCGRNARRPGTGSFCCSNCRGEPPQVRNRPPAIIQP